MCSNTNNDITFDSTAVCRGIALDLLPAVAKRTEAGNKKGAQWAAARVRLRESLVRNAAPWTCSRSASAART